MTPKKPMGSHATDVEGEAGDDDERKLEQMSWCGVGT
jgi:hypothetical protein